MTPERRECAVGEAQPRRPLLDNESLGMFPQQQMGLWKPKRCYGINTRFRSNRQARTCRETVRGSDLCLVHPGVIKGGHVTDRISRHDSAGRDSEGSSVAELS
jgi:hypothetical protein